METQQIIGTKCMMPQRYVLTLMGFLALFCAFAMRANLTIAITKMTYPVNNHDEFTSAEALCPMPEAVNTSTSADGEMQWESEIFKVNWSGEIFLFVFVGVVCCIVGEMEAILIDSSHSFYFFSMRERYGK